MIISEKNTLDNFVGKRCTSIVLRCHEIYAMGCVIDRLHIGVFFISKSFC